MNNLISLFGNVIDRGYPELKNYTITDTYFFGLWNFAILIGDVPDDNFVSVRYGRTGDAHMIYEKLRSRNNSFSIKIDKNLKNTSEKIVIGALASGASHIVRNILKVEDKNQILDQKNADILTVRRGFARELYELSTVGGLTSDEEKYDPETGLSVKDLKMYLDTGKENW